MFAKLLIANRGEIAVRVIRTVRRLGIRTVAVYSDADAEARHVKLADEAVHIGPAPANESYLVADKIIDAARRTGAEAIHPGYGFLSENASFAEACAAAGLVFIGPPAAAIRAMGEKAAAKAAMVEAGVPVVPGYHGADQNEDLLAAEATQIGYPVLIKAVAGGGGKGMRQVHDEARFATELAGARREAKAAFGDDKVLIEKYLVKPRHIEVQVFADSQGNAVHLFERDCSVQRRHQKVLEEAPAPGMSDTMRAAMGEAAVQAAKAIGYVGAGTVEFIADVSHGLRDDAFYFMEMNTRLQVEHPVTEMITGQDLVEWQLRVASGEPLPLQQDELAIDGHAVEARIYAEDPAKRFLPSTGRLLHLRPPAEDGHVRVDSGVVEGDSVSIFYDPMIAKLIAWDSDRTSALRRLRQALIEFTIAGVTTNVSFLAAVAGHPAFVAGDLDTGFIDRHRDDLIPKRDAVPDDVLAIASLHLLLARREAETARAVSGGDAHSPWALLEGWRVNDEGHDQFVFIEGDVEVAVEVRYVADGYRLGLPGGQMTASAERLADGLAVNLDGLRRHAFVIEQGERLTVLADGHAWRLARRDPMAFATFEIEETGSVAAPLPGKIVQLIAKPGQKVRKGEPLLVMEAMKMEHTIAAPADGTVEKMNYAEGEQVDEGAELVSFED
ncbi:MAG: acetyl/propionyl/methylcrotonyl-CoA carboxylase subunit alpha [Alphaproteobacteria bacterium]